VKDNPFGNCIVVVALCMMLCSLTSCSVVMAAKRSTAKDMSVLQPGADRTTVVRELGYPVLSVTLDTGGLRDTYHIDRDAHTAAAKWAAVIWHFVADVLTLTLWELVGTPLEASAKDRLVPYTVFYGTDGKLIRVQIGS